VNPIITTRVLYSSAGCKLGCLRTAYDVTLRNNACCCEIHKPWISNHFCKSKGLSFEGSTM